MGQNKIVLVIGNGFDKDLGLPSSYKEFEQSPLFKEHLKNVEKLKACVRNFKDFREEKRRAYLENFPECSIFDVLAVKADLENWYDIERQLAIIAHNRLLFKCDDSKFNLPLLDIVPITKESFWELHQCLKEYLMGISANDLSNSVAFKLLSILNNYPGNVKVSSFNYTNLEEILNIKMNLTIDHIHGKLEDDSLIIGIQDDIDIDPSYNYMIKSFSEHFRSHNLIYDLEDADEVIFFGHSLGETDYHYFKDFFRNQTVKSSAKKKLKLSIFTYDQKSRMDILQQIRNMNDKKTDMLYALCQFNLFMTKPDCNDQNRISYFLHDLERRLQFSIMIP